MNKQVLQVVIAVLLLIIGYLLYDGTKTEPESDIKISEPVITDTAEPAVEDIEEKDKSTEIEEREEVSISGVYRGLADGKDYYMGSFKYAMIDDGTEIIRVDLRSIVGYDVTGLEEDLGVSLGDTVLVKGYLENGEFIATNLRTE